MRTGTVTGRHSGSSVSAAAPVETRRVGSCSQAALVMAEEAGALVTLADVRGPDLPICGHDRPLKRYTSSVGDPRPRSTLERNPTHEDDVVIRRAFSRPHDSSGLCAEAF